MASCCSEPHRPKRNHTVVWHDLPWPPPTNLLAQFFFSFCNSGNWFKVFFVTGGFVGVDCKTLNHQGTGPHNQHCQEEVCAEILKTTLTLTNSKSCGSFETNEIINQTVESFRAKNVPLEVIFQTLQSSHSVYPQEHTTVCD